MTGVESRGPCLEYAYMYPLRMVRSEHEKLLSGAALPGHDLEESMA